MVLLVHFGVHLRRGKVLGVKIFGDSNISGVNIFGEIKIWGGGGAKLWGFEIFQVKIFGLVLNLLEVNIFGALHFSAV